MLSLLIYNIKHQDNGINKFLKEKHFGKHLAYSRQLDRDGTTLYHIK